MSPHSDYHQYARMGAASGLTPNPFRKRVTLTASERTKKLEAQTLMSVLNTKPCCHKQEPILLIIIISQMSAVTRIC